MNAHELANRLTSLSMSLLELELALNARTHFVRPLSDRHFEVSWLPVKGLDSAFRTDFGTMQEYLEVLRSQRYSVVMFDGGILQFEYVLKPGEITWHRLCFYPCPVDYVRDERDERQFAEIVEELDRNALWTDVRLRGPMRFDYHPKSVMDTHPASHLHMVNENCRIPVRSAVPPHVFVEFVFSNFYPSVWTSQRDRLSFPDWNLPLEVRTEDAAMAHVHWHGTTLPSARAKGRGGGRRKRNAGVSSKRSGVRK